MANGKYVYKQESMGNDWISVYVCDNYVNIVQRENDDEIYDVVIPHEEAIEAARSILKHFHAE